MLAFSTLFLGLIVGPATVELVATQDVAAVELLLNDESVARIEGEPWVTECDFGPALLPQSLVAIAYDASGKVLGRAEQWVNMPRPRAEISVVLEPHPQGGGTVALAWESVLPEEPSSVRISFDGREVFSDSGRRISLPAFDPERAHSLRVEAKFANQVTAVADLVVGGLYGSDLSTRLTAIPVLLEAGASLPPIDEMTGWFFARGSPLTVVAAEKGEADIVIVRDRRAQNRLNNLARLGEALSSKIITAPPGASATQRSTERPGFKSGVSQTSRFRVPFREGHNLRLLTPTPKDLGEAEHQRLIFPRSPAFSHSEVGLLRLLATRDSGSNPKAPQAFADAIAAAGQAASHLHRRRAVVLLAGPDTADLGAFDPLQARHYLENARVPLVVWTTSKKSVLNDWGSPVYIGTEADLRDALEELDEMVERQRLVWVRGAHLPQDISIGPDVSGMRLLH